MFLLFSPPFSKGFLIFSYETKIIARVNSMWDANEYFWSSGIFQF